MVRLLIGVNSIDGWLLDDTSWLSNDDAPACITRELRVSKDNQLSVWRIPSESEADKVAVSLAVGRNEHDVYYYVLFDSGELEGLNVQIKENPGMSKNSSINHLHSDLINLSSRQLSGIVEIAYKKTPTTLAPHEIKELVLAEVSSGSIDPSSLSRKMRTQLDLASS